MEQPRKRIETSVQDGFFPLGYFGSFVLLSLGGYSGAGSIFDGSSAVIVGNFWRHGMGCAVFFLF